MSIRCLLKHDYVKSLEFTPITEPTDDPRVSLIRVVEKRICSRCSREKRKEEIVPFQFISEEVKYDDQGEVI